MKFEKKIYDEFLRHCLTVEVEDQGEIFIVAGDKTAIELTNKTVSWLHATLGELIELRNNKS